MTRADAGAFRGSVPRTASFNEDNVTDKPSYLRNLAQLSDSDIAEDGPELPQTGCAR